MNTISHPRFRLGWILIAIGLCNALCWTFYRWNFENTINHAQITLDFEDTRSLSDAYGVSQNQLLRDMHERGARSLTLYNQTLGTLRDNARIAISPRESAERIYPGINWAQTPAQYRYLITSSDPKIIEQIWPRLLSSSPASARPLRVTIPTTVEEISAGIATYSTKNEDKVEGILVSNSKQLFNDVQLGYDPQQLKIARDNGYSVTARLSNPLNLTPQRLETLLDDVQKTGAKVVIFGDDEVLGYESLVSGAAREMRRRGLIFSNVEFSKARGGPDFAKNTDGELVRVHAVTADEANRAKPEVLVDRFVRAVKERDMRVILVRLIRQQKGEPTLPAKGEKLPPIELQTSAYQQNLDFVAQVSGELQRQALPIAWLRPGFKMGQAQPFGDYPMAGLHASLGEHGAKIARYLMLFLSGLGVVGATLLVLNLFFDLSEAARKKWFWAGIILVAALSISAGIGAKLMALQSGLMFPLVAILWGGLPLVWDGLSTVEGEKTPLKVALFGFKILWKTTLLTLIGGFLVVSFLNNWRYMSKADEFLGEKATQFIPLLIIPLAFLGELFPHRVVESGAAPGRSLVKARFSRALAQPFTVRIAFMSIVLLGVGYIWMARFGNESGMEISPLELQLRATLEKVFITRPRTKEIFMGHPAFLVAVLFMLRRQKWLAWGALVFATIGQTDVFNTMCHIHTPVFYSIWRSITGIILGALGGFILLWLLEKFIARRTIPALSNALEPEENKSLNFTF
ncbi:hypothetical protein B1R32_101114 [Abditibacterium utsteinense]|uniref:Uncharacterized protein n=1 Tax=Abditibacterium utsteinense TaxID=1960156 RepID=A0A2S8SX56_9BACT|nr:DUF5693 family protein [Abditibacterium utsteinense]PQV65374.1 hypothetical protein B1R32_101114 [Abditibacterium utsteinense]